jgi:hypothetical protein
MWLWHIHKDNAYNLAWRNASFSCYVAQHLLTSVCLFVCYSPAFFSVCIWVNVADNSNSAK